VQGTQVAILREILKFLFLAFLLWLHSRGQGRMVRGNRGHKDPRLKAKLPRRAGLLSEKVFELGKDKSLLTLLKYRTGYNAAWKRPKTRRYMKERGFKAPGEWDPNNLQAGRIFGSNKEVRFITESMAENILWKAFKKDKATLANCRDISRMLSFARQLQTGVPGDQFASVKATWKNMRNPAKFLKPRKSHKATESLESEEVKTVLYDTEWTLETPVPYPLWCVWYLMTWDSLMNGLRSKEDFKRVKYSQDHHFNAAEKWMFTEMLGGRCKTEKRLGPRPARVHRTCTCEGPHRGLPELTPEEEKSGEDPLFNDLGEPKYAYTGDPRGIPWSTVCPLTCWEVICHWLKRSGWPANRPYPKWNVEKCRFGKEDHGRKLIFPCIKKFIEIQGGNPTNRPLCPNGGRKTLGKLLQDHEVPTEVGYQLHLDEQNNWRKYQAGMMYIRGFKPKGQSRNPRECIVAHLMIISDWHGLVPPQVNVPPRAQPPKRHRGKAKVTSRKRQKKEEKPEPDTKPDTKVDSKPELKTEMVMSEEMRSFFEVLKLNVRMMGGGVELKKVLGN